MSIIQKLFFRFRYSIVNGFFSLGRKLFYCSQGLHIGSRSSLPKAYFTWPHKVSIGANCILEPNIYFKFDGIWEPGVAIDIGNNVFIGFGCEFNIRKRIFIDNDSLIASGCRFIDHNHGLSTSELIRVQEQPASEINIGKNVWIGCNAVILKGVTIEDGAVVAAGAVVTKSISRNEIWAGVPARKVGVRS